MARSIYINEVTHAAIDDIGRRGVGKQGKWHEIEEKPNHKLKYNINSKIPKECSTGPLADLLTDYANLVLDKILQKKDYIVGKHNLLKNDGEILYDQMPPRYYPTRSK